MQQKEYVLQHVAAGIDICCEYNITKGQLPSTMFQATTNQGSTTCSYIEKPSFAGSTTTFYSGKTDVLVASLGHFDWGNANR